MCPSKNSDYAKRGCLIPIGGAEEKFHNPEILDRFVDICGGKGARIAIIPTASELEENVNPIPTRTARYKPTPRSFRTMVADAVSNTAKN